MPKKFKSFFLIPLISLLWLIWSSSPAESFAACPKEKKVWLCCGHKPHLWTLTGLPYRSAFNISFMEKNYHCRRITKTFSNSMCSSAGGLVFNGGTVNFVGEACAFG